MQTSVDRLLIHIIKEAIHSPTTPDARAIATYAKSYLSPHMRTDALAQVKELLNSAACIKGPRDVCYALGTLAYNKFSGPIPLYDGPEERNSSHWRLHLGYMSLGLPSEKYYAADADDHEKGVMADYSSMLHGLGKKFGIADLEQFASIETDYASIIRKGELESTAVHDGKDLPKVFPGIDWESFWEPFGEVASRWKSMRVVVDAPSWLKYVEKMLKTFTVERWRLYIRAIYLTNLIAYLPTTYNAGYVDFFNERLSGVSVRPTKYKELLGLVKELMGPSLSRLYIARTVDNAHQVRIRRFAQKLVDATVALLRKNTWMSANTRLTAIRKVRQMHMGILYPGRRSPYVAPALVDSDIVKNTMLIGQAHTVCTFKAASTQASADAWEYPVYAVNAYYLAAGNRLIVPAAIAEWPFYCGRATAGWNYGGLGAMLGHEITHAFDDDGKEYDARGNKRAWWTARDYRAYKKVSQGMINLYNKSRIFDRHVDGTTTLSENLADLGGIAIALEALRGEIAAKSAADQRRELRDFFTSYATSWREKQHRAQVIQQLIADEHSPAQFRVNNIVQQFDEWYEAFNVVAGDPLYIEPAKRLRIY